MPTLDEKLDRELSWRKVEISNLYLQLESAEGDLQKVLLRASWVMLYAHWEGFIKRSTEIYIKNINSTQIHCKYLQRSFAFLLFKKDIEELFETKKVQRAHEIYKTMINSQSLFVKMHEEIDTKSNLNPEIFYDILSILPIDSEFYMSNSSIINDLVKDRNEIAHGAGLPITIDTFKDTRDRILTIMERYKNDLCDCFYSEKFKLHPA